MAAIAAVELWATASSCRKRTPPVSFPRWILSRLSRIRDQAPLNKVPIFVHVFPRENVELNNGAYNVNAVVSPGLQNHLRIRIGNCRLSLASCCWVPPLINTLITRCSSYELFIDLVMNLVSCVVSRYRILRLACLSYNIGSQTYQSLTSNCTEVWDPRHPWTHQNRPWL